MARGSRLFSAVLLGLLLVAVLPTGAATDYTGPGQTGVVPLGEGGRTIDTLAGRADDRVFAAVTGIPADTCRVVIDQNGTYAPTGVTWAPGDDTAYVWAEDGASDVPYRLHAVWHTDLNGNCTVEETETQTFWHDPRGRPYTEPWIEGHLAFYRGVAGNATPIRFVVGNNGTIDATVTARIPALAEGFRATSDGRVVDVVIAPEEEVSFTFLIDVPVDAKPFRYPIQSTFASTDGWSQGATAILEIRAPPGGVPAPTATDASDAAPLPPPTVAAEEAPLVFPSLLVLLVAVAASLRRR